jgi:hypothetical protein
VRTLQVQEIEVLIFDARQGGSGSDSSDEEQEGEGTGGTGERVGERSGSSKRVASVSPSTLEGDPSKRAKRIASAPDLHHLPAVDIEERVTQSIREFSRYGRFS